MKKSNVQFQRFKLLYISWLPLVVAQREYTKNSNLEPCWRLFVPSCFSVAVFELGGRWACIHLHTCQESVLYPLSDLRVGAVSKWSCGAIRSSGRNTCSNINTSRCQKRFVILVAKFPSSCGPATDLGRALCAWIISCPVLVHVLHTWTCTVEPNTLPRWHRRGEHILTQVRWEGTCGRGLWCGSNVALSEPPWFPFGFEQCPWCCRASSVYSLACTFEERLGWRDVTPEIEHAALWTAIWLSLCVPSPQNR